MVMMNHTRYNLHKYLFLLAGGCFWFLLLPLAALADASPSNHLALLLKPSDRRKWYGEVGSGPTTTASSKIISITSPNGGEHLIAGERYLITWNQRSGSVNYASLYYKTYPNGQEELIAPRVSFEQKDSAGYYLWFVPYDLGEHYYSYKIVVKGYSGGRQVGSDESDDYFSITAAGQSAPQVLAGDLKAEALEIRLTYPNGVEYLQPGKQVFITWNQKYLNYVDIGLWTDREQPVEWIVQDYQINPNQTSGSYRWPVPSDGFSDVFYKIYISGKRSGVGAVRDTSDDFFTITADGSGQVGTEYIGPAIVPAGEAVKLSWRYHNIEQVSLFYAQYPLALNSNFQKIAYAVKIDTENGGHDQTAGYTWQVPSNLSSGYYVIRLDGYISGRQVAADYSANYVWIGAAGDRLDEIAVERPNQLAIETKVEMLGQYQARVRWSLGDAVNQQKRVVLHYGRTVRYGQTVSFDPALAQRSIVLDDVVPGYIYHYQLTQGELATEDRTFQVPGGVRHLGYYVLRQAGAGMQVRLSWDSVWQKFLIYYCAGDCQPDNLDRWQRVAQINGREFAHQNNLKPGQTGYYLVVPSEIAQPIKQQTYGMISVKNRAASPALAVNQIQPQYLIADQFVFDQLKGRIIIKAQSDGAAFYINPQTKLMHYLGRPNEAWTILKSQAVGISNADLLKIPVGLDSLSGIDTDTDGLPDFLEESLGTDKLRPDTDGDGYVDGLEIANNYSPLVRLAKLPIDLDFARRQQGRIFLQVEGRGEMWYLNPADDKRYLLSEPAAVLAVMRQQSLGVSDDFFQKIVK